MLPNVTSGMTGRECALKMILNFVCLLSNSKENQFSDNETNYGRQLLTHNKISVNSEWWLHGTNHIYGIKWIIIDYWCLRGNSSDQCIYQLWCHMISQWDVTSWRYDIIIDNYDIMIHCLPFWAFQSIICVNRIQFSVNHKFAIHYHQLIMSGTNSKADAWRMLQP